ncbi:hypothetical protein BD770DRAFT_162068 [Pilaira anomala]|nr:hypothetical protein BD770DRAFT_162068 [Pilaira anomala]
MSSSSWNCLEWLTTNYHLNNVGVNFFRTGKYLISQKEQAECDFKDTVFLLCNSEHNDIKKWARAEVETGYRSIINTETQAFWTSSAITSSIRNDIIQTESKQFINLNKSSFEKRSNDESATSSPKRRDIEIIENDNVILNGLNGSLFSYLKTYAINRMHDFNSFNDKQKFYITMSMNNVIDLTDDTEFSQLHLLNPEQKEELRTILKINKLSTDQPVVDNIKDKLEKYERNLSHCLSKVSKLFMNSNGDVSICGIYRHM